MRHSNQNLTAAGAADDGAHRCGIDGGCTDHANRVAVGANNFSRGHLERKDLPEHAACGIAIELLVIVRHAAPPLAPKRSVLTCSGSWPRSTSVDATISTSAVGPQTNASG